MAIAMAVPPRLGQSTKLPGSASKTQRSGSQRVQRLRRIALTPASRPLEAIEAICARVRPLRRDDGTFQGFDPGLGSGGRHRFPDGTSAIYADLMSQFQRQTNSRGAG